MDCMELMREYPDKYFELAIVDPEFGIGIARSARLVTDKGLSPKSWDDKPINPLYFNELFRVSQNQIIWGGNYYALLPTKHCIIWDKEQPEAMSFGMFDYAWTSFCKSNKMFRQSVRVEGNCYHPSQKPIALYRWLLANYAKTGDKILDTHLGSMSHAIAAHYAGLHLTGCELDPDYFAAGIERVKRETAQMDMFADAPKIAQAEQLFLDSPSA